MLPACSWCAGPGARDDSSELMGYGQTAGEGEGAGIEDDGRRAVRRAGDGQVAADFLKNQFWTVGALVYLAIKSL